MAASTGSARAPLTRERVLAAALRLIDERGLGELTMEALGAELGVEAMSIYEHVPSEGAALGAVAELLPAESETEHPTSSEWRAHVTGLGRRFRAVSLARPSVFPLLHRCSLSAYVVGHAMAAAALETMIAGGLARDDAIAAPPVAHP